MNKNDQEFLVQKIRSRYTEKESTKLDELKELDKKVKTPANVFAYVFGSISAIIMGAGMSLVMTDLGETLGMGDAMVPGVVIGVIGLVLALVNYPLYKKMFAMILGVVGTLILGLGMCCILVWQGVWFVPGILIGLLGIAGLSVAYPVYIQVTKKEREKIAPEIMQLTDELLK